MNEKDRDQFVFSGITKAARHASGDNPAHAKAVERFLRTGNIGLCKSTRYSLERIKKEGEHFSRCKAALWNLFDTLSGLLPESAGNAPAVTPEMIQEKVKPMVLGLVQADWRDIALRELGTRIFVLNPEGTRRAIEAELSTSWLGNAWNVFWLYFEDYKLKPKSIKLPSMEGITSGTFAHVSHSAYERNDDRFDVVVHEAAHLLHYLKPKHYSLHVKRGQERFVDVKFLDRELFAYTCEAYTKVLEKGKSKAVKTFTEEIWKACACLPESKSFVKEIAGLLLKAAKSRNGWKVIKERTIEKRDRA
ncbi:MAG: hypothetical protein Q7R35_19970, partial [Elusimicrobiota bacterium]|nr:hypothetical protein [Elusimicrobiota bacterium]